MNRFGKKILVWLVSLGKTKSTIIFCLLASVAYFIFVILCQLLNSLLNRIGYSNLISDQLSFGAPIFILIILEPWHFYKKTIIALDTVRHLEKKGLTPEDIQRISFIKTWEKTRKFGVRKFCFYNGGIIAGIILTIPLAIMILLIVSYLDLISGYERLLIFAVSDIVLCYLLGVMIYYIRWQRNEQKFIRLTDPLH